MIQIKIRANVLSYVKLKAFYSSILFKTWHACPGQLDITSAFRASPLIQQYIFYQFKTWAFNPCSA